MVEGVQPRPSRAPHPPRTAWILLNTFLPLPGHTAWGSGPTEVGQHVRGRAPKRGWAWGQGLRAQARLGQLSRAGCCPPALGQACPHPTRVLAAAHDHPVARSAPCGEAGPSGLRVKALPAPPGPAPPATPTSVWHAHWPQPLSPHTRQWPSFKRLVHLKEASPRRPEAGSWGPGPGELERRGSRRAPGMASGGQWSIPQPKLRDTVQPAGLSPPSPASVPHVHRHSPSRAERRGPFTQTPSPRMCPGRATPLRALNRPPPGGVCTSSAPSRDSATHPRTRLSRAPCAPTRGASGLGSLRVGAESGDLGEPDGSPTPAGSGPPSVALPSQALLPTQLQLGAHLASPSPEQTHPPSSLQHCPRVYRQEQHEEPSSPAAPAPA